MLTRILGATGVGILVVGLSPIAAQPFRSDVIDGSINRSLTVPTDLTVPTPWHLTGVHMVFDDPRGLLEDVVTLSTILTVRGDVGEGINLYIAPFNTYFQGFEGALFFYGGIQTSIDGRTNKNDPWSFVSRGKGAIFSRWNERHIEAIDQAPGGLAESSGHEGDFISVRNDMQWETGRYRLSLIRGPYVHGDPLPPPTAERSDVANSWGRLEHTWIRMEATNLDTGKTTFIGALAFPGRTFSLNNVNWNAAFVEIYGSPDPFPAARTPKISITFERYQVNGQDLTYREIDVSSNSIAGPESVHPRTPEMTTASYDTDTGQIRLQVGSFTGNYGQRTTTLFPKTLTLTTPPVLDFTCHGYDEGATRAYNCIPKPSQQYHMRTFVPAVGSACDGGSIAEFPPGRVVFQIRCRNGSDTSARSAGVRRRTTPPVLDFTCHGHDEGATRAYNCIPKPSQQYHMRTFVPAVGSACDGGSIAEFPPGRVVFQIRCRNGSDLLRIPVQTDH